MRRAYRHSSPVMREVTTRGLDGWKSRSKGISSWRTSMAAAGGESGGAAGRRETEREGAEGVSGYKAQDKTTRYNIFR